MAIENKGSNKIGSYKMEMDKRTPAARLNFEGRLTQ